MANTLTVARSPIPKKNAPTTRKSSERVARALLRWWGLSEGRRQRRLSFTVQGAVYLTYFLIYDIIKMRSILKMKLKLIVCLFFEIAPLTD